VGFRTNKLIKKKLTPGKEVLLEKLTVLQTVTKFPVFYEKFITLFTTAHKLPISRARLIHSTPSRPTYLRHILILFFHRFLGRGSDFFPSGFLITTLNVFLFSSILPHALSIPLSLDLMTQKISGQEHNWSISTLIGGVITVSKTTMYV